MLGIAVEKYQHHSNLKNVILDTEAILDCLQRKISPLTTYIYNTDATKVNIERLFEKYLPGNDNELSPEDSLIIYLSGHFEYLAGRKFFVPSDGKDNSSSMISFDFFEKFFSRYKSKHILLIFNHYEIDDPMGFVR